MTTLVSPARLRGRHLVASFLGGCLIGPLCCLGLALAGLLAGVVHASAARGAAPEPPVTVARLSAELAALPAGEAADGASVFQQAGGCAACHALTPGERRVGPALAGVAARAAGHDPDHAGALYLYESVVAPEAYIVAGFPAHVMPGNFRARLTPQQLADLVAFLLEQ